MTCPSASGRPTPTTSPAAPAPVGPAAPVPGVPAAPWASACPAWAAPAARRPRWLRHGPARADAHAARADAQPVVRPGRRRPRELQAGRADGAPAARRRGQHQADERAAARGRGVGAARRAVARGRDDAARRAPRTVAVWSPAQWVDTTMPTWQRLCDPVAQRVAGAWVEGLPEEARQMAGPMLGMISQVGGMAFGSQLGAGLAQLAKEVLTSSEVGLPLGPEGTAALLPAAIATLHRGPRPPGGRGARLPRRPRGRAPAPVRARAVAAPAPARHRRGVRPRHHHRHLAHGGARARRRPDRTRRSLQQAHELGDVRAADHRVAEGRAAPPRDPARARRGLGRRGRRRRRGRPPARRRRARARRCVAAAPPAGPPSRPSPPSSGLELRPRRLRDAAALWRALTDERGIEGRDAVWSHPDLMPTADDLDDPAALPRRHEAVGPARARRAPRESFTDLDDPLARLEAEMKAEQEAKDADRRTEPGRRATVRRPRAQSSRRRRLTVGLGDREARRPRRGPRGSRSRARCAGSAASSARNAGPCPGSRRWTSSCTSTWSSTQPGHLAQAAR